MPSPYHDIAADYHHFFPPQLARLEMLAALAGHPPASVLDLACGTGEYVTALAKRGYTVWGVDVDPAMHERGLRRHPQLADRLIQGDMLEVFDLVRGPLNLVYCIGSGLAHLASLEEVTDVLAQMRDLTQPGGAMLIKVANFDHLVMQAARAAGLARESRDAAPTSSAVEFDQPVYVELLDPEHGRDSPQMASLSQTELRLYLAPHSANRDDGSRIELERIYTAGLDEWLGDTPPEQISLSQVLRTPEGESSAELPLLCLTRARLERCINEALARTHGQGAEITWYGSFEGADWDIAQSASIVVVR